MLAIELINYALHLEKKTIQLVRKLHYTFKDSNMYSPFKGIESLKLTFSHDYLEGLFEQIVGLIP